MDFLPGNELSGSFIDRDDTALNLLTPGLLSAGIDFCIEAFEKRIGECSALLRR